MKQTYYIVSCLIFPTISKSLAHAKNHVNCLKKVYSEAFKFAIQWASISIFHQYKDKVRNNKENDAMWRRPFYYTLVIVSLMFVGISLVSMTPVVP